MNSGAARLWRRIPRMGMLALAAFVLCVVTGVMLVPAYRPGSPLDSLALLSLKNPAGVFVRSLHYWSAQAFLVLIAAHVVDHWWRRSERVVRFGIWLRLVLALPVVLAVMLSGFLLRADAAAEQALPVLRTLLGFIPFAGMAADRLLTGSGTNLSTIYIHHACTATVILWLVTVEHTRRILPTAWSLLWIAPPILLLSAVLVPGLEWRTSAVEKGPWYLVGLQEFLHWLPRPQFVVWVGGVVLVLLIGLPKFPLHIAAVPRTALVSLALFYAALTVVGLAFRGDAWRWMSPVSVLAGGSDFLPYRAYLPPASALIETRIPLVNGRREGCLACHQKMTGFVAAHDPATIGCASCHLGNPWTLDKKLAHTGMTLTPGNLSAVAQTCGASNCHTDQAQRVRTSPMNTMSGVIAVDKFAFGENSDLDARYNVADLQHTLADTHLRSLCASCHLGQDKLHPASIDETSRGGGCSACHLRYDAAAGRELSQRGSSTAPLHHPEISIHVPQDACFGCHSRSGRIATSYEGWQETPLDEKAAQSSPGWPPSFRVLADGRVFARHPADIHAEKGMACIDCHQASEVMGDGAFHAHERDAVKIACVDCHAAGRTAAREYGQLDAETQQIIAMRRLNEPGRKFVVSESGTASYPNVFLDERGAPTLSLMNAPGLLRPKPMAAACTAAFHQRLECSACHTPWAPQCITCHTSFDRRAQGWDYLAGKWVDGDWQEQGQDNRSDAPALGIERISTPGGRSADRIATFIPGMILRLDLPGRPAGDPPRFRRLFAPASAHTTATRARDCRSCHNNPAALGYGRGRLQYAVTGRTAQWQFTPQYSASPEDGLPADAWIGFLQEPAPLTTTRKGARPFSLEEQRRILLVGACLACHDEKDRRIARVFADFTNYRTALSSKCVLPAWSKALSQYEGNTP
ncbi:MAG: DUF4405 domain-containing protein [Acidobacteriota bacterium]